MKSQELHFLFFLQAKAGFPIKFATFVVQHFVSTGPTLKLFIPLAPTTGAGPAGKFSNVTTTS